ncbi:uncharacterized protein KGF55_002748 [Candida pseudojiufengensis]|uniref:uncharacterized protein n=1 Tax=Candida pseudojiufengensis TaxID=497109 RepID=UPI00222432BF|nr:uncharacterized protein KGF55_002748 [Candida pseudojiufengensis]KAI5962956.1 hypothetical protein KGF55_002748 [Candida pseudojiufengensis]
MFIFLSLPSGNEQPHSELERDTLTQFQTQYFNSLKILNESQYDLGYGNITGYQLSYKDYLTGKSIKDWPIHEYSKEHPWVENEEYSILPNVISNNVKQFWGNDEVKLNENAYLLNISGRANGEFIISQTENKIEPIKLKIPEYLKTYYNSRTTNDGSDYDGRLTTPSDQKDKDEKEKDKLEKELELSEKVGNITKPGVISLDITGYQYNFNEPEFKTLSEKDKISNAIALKMELNLKDYKEIEDHRLGLSGVYFQDTGSIIATTNSAKFLGSYGLSHLSMDNKKFEIAKKLMTQYNNMRDDKDINLDDMNNSIFKSIDQCEMIAFIQFNKTNFNHEELRYIDNELKNPTGKPLPSKIPVLSVKDFLIYSPDCGISLTIKPNTLFIGERNEVYKSQIRKVLTGLLILVIIQLYLIFNQVNEARTPGQLSVISSKTLYFFGFQDSLLALMSLLLSTVATDLYLILACISTIAFISCGVFEIRFMVSVLTTQANERGTTWWEIMRGSSQESNESTPEPAIIEENQDGPILPISNPPPQQPEQPTTEPNQAWQETSYSNSIFASGFTLSIIAMFLIFSATQWRVTYRIIFEYISLILINSYWVPQFLRNTLKNRNKSFTWKFIFGSSIIRIIPIYYFSLFKSNPARHRYDPTLCIIITVWLSFQILLLILQNYFGARFWINEKWLPKAYDYQPILSIKDLEEGGISSDLLASFKQKTSDSAAEQQQDFIDCECTCPICMTDVTLPILVKNEETKDKKSNHLHINKDYMITPCHHIFHVECLENWMKYKLQCPVCRTSLPPI